MEHPASARGPSRGLSRRELLTSALAAGAAAAWAPVFRVLPASADATCPPPPSFPGGIPLYQQAYESWSGEVRVDDVWTAAPASAADVVTLANWARANGYRLRARGFAHNFSPLILTNAESCGSNVVLVDTREHLDGIQVMWGRVRVGTGASMEELLAALQSGLQWIGEVPAPGGLTVGGVIAIGGHGAGVENGSISNRIIEMDAVVWDDAASAYVLRTVHRSDPDARALMVNLGRAFLTSVTLKTELNRNLRCQSYVGISAAQLFAPQGSGGQTMSSFIADAGRAEAIWFPFTANPWLKVWSDRLFKPLFAKKVTAPYPYPFTHGIDPEQSEMLAQILAGAAWLTPLYGALQSTIVTLGLLGNAAFDLWGASRYLLHYQRSDTFRVTTNGLAVLCRRADVQRVLHDFYIFHSSTLAAKQAVGQFPINGPAEIRVTGIDRASASGVAGAQTSSLGSLVPRVDHPEFDTCCWLSVLTNPGTPGAAAYYEELEQWAFGNYTGDYATVRVEWSKGWGYTPSGAWTSATTIGTVLPDSLRDGRPAGEGWDDGVERLHALDPHRVFTNPLLDTLLQ